VFASFFIFSEDIRGTRILSDIKDRQILEKIMVEVMHTYYVRCRWKEEDETDFRGLGVLCRAVLLFQGVKFLNSRYHQAVNNM
jgi:hypothetical protein